MRALRRVDFFLREFLHVGVGQHLLRGVDVAVGLLVLLVQRDQRTEFGVLARQLAVAVHVGGDAFLHQQFVQFVQPVGQLVELGEHGWFHSDVRS